MAPPSAQSSRASATPRRADTAVVRADAQSGAADLQVIIRELAAVADYIAHVKKEIGALRANELTRDRLPEAHEELGNVVDATASATHAIMTAAEEILNSGECLYESYRAQVEGKVMEIFEACSFQDITGQRIAKVVEALAQLETRLGRFATAVSARDAADALDPEEVVRQTRRKALLLNGPALHKGEGVDQDEIDRLFG